MKYLLIFSLIITSIYANNPIDIINKQIQDIEQKRVYEEQQENQAKTNKKLFDDTSIKIDEDIEEENRIYIKTIEIKGVTVFEDGYFDNIIKPYLALRLTTNNASNLKARENIVLDSLSDINIVGSTLQSEDNITLSSTVSGFADD